jgi:peptidylprolyl isomerase
LPIEKGKQAKVRYVGTLEDGTVFDSNEKGELLSFVVGSGQIIKGFDSAVMGMEKGDEKEITLQPADAYGNPDPRLIMKVPRTRFPKNVELEVGMPLHLSSPDGDHVQAIVTAVNDVEATIDLNSPLAGKVLHFKIKLVEYGEPDPNQCGCGCNDCGHGPEENGCCDDDEHGEHSCCDHDEHDTE